MANLTQEAIVCIWRDMLELTDISESTHFLEYGGDSLFAVHLGAQLERVFGIAPSFRELFDLGTVEQLTRWFDSRATL